MPSCPANRRPLSSRCTPSGNTLVSVLLLLFRLMLLSHSPTYSPVRAPPPSRPLTRVCAFFAHFHRLRRRLCCRSGSFYDAHAGRNQPICGDQASCTDMPVLPQLTTDGSAEANATVANSTLGNSTLGSGTLGNSTQGSATPPSQLAYSASCECLPPVVPKSISEFSARFVPFTTEDGGGCVEPRTLGDLTVSSSARTVSEQLTKPLAGYATSERKVQVAVPGTDNAMCSWNAFATAANGSSPAGGGYLSILTPAGTVQFGDGTFDVLLKLNASGLAENLENPYRALLSINLVCLAYSWSTDSTYSKAYQAPISVALLVQSLAADGSWAAVTPSNMEKNSIDCAEASPSLIDGALVVGNPGVTNGVLFQLCDSEQMRVVRELSVTDDLSVAAAADASGVETVLFNATQITSSGRTLLLSVTGGGEFVGRGVYWVSPQVDTLGNVTLQAYISGVPRGAQLVLTTRCASGLGSLGRAIDSSGDYCICTAGFERTGESQGGTDSSENSLGGAPTTSSASSCAACGAGHFKSDEADRQCEACPAGSYQPDGVIGATSCIPCAIGTSSSEAGSTACSACEVRDPPIPTLWCLRCLPATPIRPCIACLAKLPHLIFYRCRKEHTRPSRAQLNAHHVQRGPISNRKGPLRVSNASKANRLRDVASPRVPPSIRRTASGSFCVHRPHPPSVS